MELFILVPTSIYIYSLLFIIKTSTRGPVTDQATINFVTVCYKLHSELVLHLST